MKRLLPLALAGAALLAAPPSRPDPGRGDVVGRSVLEALASRPRVRVVVALRDPEVSARASELDRRVAEVRTLVDAVVSDLPPDSFLLVHRFEAISAIVGEATLEAVERLAADPDVLKVDLDVSGHAGTGESVPLIRGDDVRDAGVTGRGVVVAVVDTGVDTDHPDLKDAIVDQQCFCASASGAGCCPNGATSMSGAGAAEDDQGHGTNVAGIIVGRGRVARRGVAPEASLVAIKALDAQGGFSSTTQILQAFDYVLTRRPEVRVMNFSLGTAQLFPGVCDNDASFTVSFAQAINGLRGRGTLTFASSLNNGSGTSIGLPACIGAAVAVGAVYDGNVGSVVFGCTDATTRADQVACFSNSNSVVDLLAPGASITAAGRGGGTSTFLGTSQACPHAAGAAALLISARSSLTADQVEAALKNTGVAITDPKNGVSIRRIDVKAALDQARTF
ncbi:MAG TPA: S8 family serine peptidase [Vicinamibacteria bacterium]|nr:S8 family serine peptidase [Vicinamibacteria bacterium]